MDLAQLKRAHVLVTGDAMLDRYWFGVAEPIAVEHGVASNEGVCTLELS